MNWRKPMYAVAVFASFAGFWLLAAGQPGNAAITLLVIAFPAWALLSANHQLNPTPNYHNRKEHS